MMYLIQDSLIFPGHTSNELERTNLLKVHQERLKAFHWVSPAGDSLEGWHLTEAIPSEEIDIDSMISKPQQKRVVLYFGGNAEDVWDAVPLLSSIQGQVVALNYPGFGENVRCG